MDNFESLGIKQELLQGLKAKNITTPTPVQIQAIPIINNIIQNSSQENNFLVVAEAETGTGKTYAYLLPLIQAINPEIKQAQLIIVTPTRELASQIKTEADFICTNAQLHYKTVLLIGDAPLKRQIERLKEKPQIITGTIGRITELINLKKIKAPSIRFMVLDEVDRLFSTEMRDDLRDLVSLCPSSVSFVACSATINKHIQDLIEDTCNCKKENTFILRLPQEDVLKKRIKHWAFFAEQRDKINLLRSFILGVNPQKMLIFTAETGQVANIVSQLIFKKIPGVDGLHAKLDKFSRKQIIDNFRKGKTRILVTSDLSARGLDIQEVTHIVQMDVPSNEDFFIHRAGRTGRAGLTGINAIFATEKELFKLSKIEKKLEIVIYPMMMFKGKPKLIPQDEIETSIKDGTV